MQKFGLGVAGSESEALLRHLSARGFRSEELELAGLVVVTDQGPRDRFRDRLMFPIRNPRGECVGFGGRTLIDEPAKYVNTPESPLFEKRTLLYGLDLARDAIRSAGYVIVVEGYTDVISAHEHGSAQTVASMGTALTDSQVGLLKPLTRDIRFALDADAAGQAATRRGIETARAGMGASSQVAIDPRGIIRQQDQLAADIRIIQLPEGRDPDDLIRRDPQLWNELVEGAPAFLDWLFERGRETHNLEDARGRSDFARELAPLAYTIADPVIRDEYLNRVAAFARVEVSALPRQANLEHNRRTQEPGAMAEPTAPTRRRVADGPQEYLLRLVVARDEAAEELGAGALGLIDDAADREILEARLGRLGDAEWAAELPASTQERVAELRAGARELPPLTIDEARAAARQAAERLGARRKRESLRLQTQNLARIEEELDRATVALAADAVRAGSGSELGPELTEAAARVVQARDDALSLHHRGPGESASGDSSDQELVRPAARGSQR